MTRHECSRAAASEQLPSALVVEEAEVEDATVYSLYPDVTTTTEYEVQHCEMTINDDNTTSTIPNSDVYAESA